MCKSKFTESQIVATLKQVEGGRQVKDVCRDLAISEATYYVWKSKCGGMDAADVRRLWGGRRFRTFNVINDFTREVLASRWT
jgi:putative transposase